MPEEAAWQRQGTLVRLDAALDEEYLQTRFAQRQDHKVDGEHDGGRSPLVLGHVVRVAFCRDDKKREGEKVSSRLGRGPYGWCWCCVFLTASAAPPVNVRSASSLITEMAVIAAVFDFAVDIGSAEGEGYRVRARSPDGREVAGTMRLRRADLEVLAARIPDAVVISSVAVRRAVPVHELPVRRLGGMLYQALFTGDEQTAHATRNAVDDGKQQRQEHQVEPPELASLPWEFLFDPDEDDYLCV